MPRLAAVAERCVRVTTAASIMRWLFEAGVDIRRKLGAQGLHLQPELLEMQSQARYFPILLGNGVVECLDNVVLFAVQNFQSIQSGLQAVRHVRHLLQIKPV